MGCQWDRGLQPLGPGVYWWTCVAKVTAGQVRSSLRPSQERYEVREGVYLTESKFVGTVPGSMIMETHC